MTYISFYRNHAFICINATHFIHSSYTIQCRSVTLFYDQLKPITNHHDHHHLSLLRNPVQETWIFSRPVHNFPCRAFLGPAKTHLHASPPPWLPPSLPLAAPSCRLRSESAADRHAWGSFAGSSHLSLTSIFTFLVNAVFLTLLEQTFVPHSLTDFTYHFIPFPSYTFFDCIWTC